MVLVMERINGLKVVHCQVLLGLQNHLAATLARVKILRKLTLYMKSPRMGFMAMYHQTSCQVGLAMVGLRNQLYFMRMNTAINDLHNRCALCGYHQSFKRAPPFLFDVEYT